MQPFHCHATFVFLEFLLKLLFPLHVQYTSTIYCSSARERDGQWTPFLFLRTSTVLNTHIFKPNSCEPITPLASRLLWVSFGFSYSNLAIMK